MRKLLVFLLLLSSVGCFSQYNSLTVSFSPSFDESTKVSVEKENAGYALSISGKYDK